MIKFSPDHIENRSGSDTNTIYIILVFACIAVFSLVIIQYNINRINKKLNEQLRNNLILAETILPPALWQFNYDYLGDVIKAITIDDIVVYVRILADDKSLSVFYRPGTEILTFSEFQMSSGHIAGSSDILYGGKVIGSVEIVVSRKGIYKELIFNTMVAFILVSVVAAAIKKYYRKLTETQRQYLSLYENTIEGIYQTTPDGRIAKANPAMASILGYESPAELIASVSDLSSQVYVHHENRDELVRILREKDFISEYETQFYRKDGSIFWVSLSARAVRDSEGSVKLIEGLLVDITERIEKEKAERDRREAELAARAKTEFLANMSHEIRTPLNAIIGLSDLALKTELTQRQRDYMEKIRSSAKMLTGIIDNILDFSRIETGKLRLESAPFRLQDIIDTIADMFAKPVVEKNIDMFIDADDDLPNILIGDSLRLGQILINLIGNAVKFTENGEVLLKIEPVSDTVGAPDTVIRFSVADTGIGIHPDNVPKLFTTFSQVDGSMTRKYGGTGLGLSICKRLAELMGGSISVESEPKKGSTFSFSLKFETRHEDPDKEPVKVPDTFRNLRILIADDHPVSSGIIIRSLRKYSFKTELFRTIDEAVCRLNEPRESFDLILADEKILNGHGIRMISSVGKISGGESVPIVIMTGFGKEDRFNPICSHMDFIIKPISRAYLLKRIISVLENTPEKSVQKENIPQIETGVSFRGAKILLVEDNIINQQVAAEILQNAGFSVTIACNGEEAVETVKQSDFDTVLMDIQMPVMDGIEATKRIRSIRDNSVSGDTADPFPYSRLPVIAMTAHAMEEDKEKCFKAGMNDYIAKPIDPDLLLKTIGQWIQPMQTDAKVSDDSRRITAAADACELPISIEGIDTESALQRLGGNRKLLKKLLFELSSEYGHVAELIAESLKNKQTDIALQWVHTLKGVAGNISAKTLYTACMALEKGIKENDQISISSLKYQFESAFGELMTSVQKLKEEEQKNDNRKTPDTSDEKRELSDAAAIADHIRTLYDMLSKHSPRSEQLMESLKEKLNNTRFHDDIHRLDDLINRFNFKDSKNLLKQIAQAMGISIEQS